jgi:hypothetical protein
MPLSSARPKWRASCAGFPVAIRTAMVTRLRSRGDNSARRQTSPNNTASVSVASPGQSLAELVPTAGRRLLRLLSLRVGTSRRGVVLLVAHLLHPLLDHVWSAAQKIYRLHMQREDERHCHDYYAGWRNQRAQIAKRRVPVSHVLQHAVTLIRATAQSPLRCNRRGPAVRHDNRVTVSS